MPADGTQTAPLYHRPPVLVPKALLERQRLSRELYGWENEFTIANRGHATPPEIERTLEDLNETATEIVTIVRAFEERFKGSIAAGASFSINAAYLADLLADTLADGMTEDAARVLNAAVKREMA